MITIYKCDLTREYVAYDDNYLDEDTPHGRGFTEKEALEDLRDTMEHFFNDSRRMLEWSNSLTVTIGD